MTDSLADKLAYWRQRGAPGRLRRQGTTRARVVYRDDNGKPSGTQVDHWDGRMDANIVMPTVRWRTRTERGESGQTRRDVQ